MTYESHSPAFLLYVDSDVEKQAYKSRQNRYESTDLGS